MEEQRSYFARVRGDFPRWCLRVWVVLLLLITALYGIAVTTPHVRLIQLFTLAWGVLVGVLYLRRLLAVFPIARIFFLGIGMLLAAWMLLAGRPPDREGLRAMYASRLHAFVRTRFVWGGETHLGVDCSGLARTAFCEAICFEGIREGNPRLLGPLLWRYWWRDMSARAMGGGVYGYTRMLGRARRLADGDTSALQPGDLAVTDGGAHVLIFLGNRQWIEANPNDERVVINAAVADSPRGYFNMPVTFARWWLLDASP